MTTRKFSYDEGERVRATAGLHEGKVGTVKKVSPSGPGHYYSLLFDGHQFEVLVHYFNLKRVEPTTDTDRYAVIVVSKHTGGASTLAITYGEEGADHAHDIADRWNAKSSWVAHVVGLFPEVRG